MKQDGTYLKTSPEYAKILKTSPEKLKNTPWENTVIPQDLPYVKKAYQDMIDTGFGQAIATGIKQNGEKFKKLISLVNDPDPKQYYCFMIDLSELRNDPYGKSL